MATPARSVRVTAGPADVAGLAVYYGGLAQAARAMKAAGHSISRGTLDGIISGRQSMGEKARAAIGGMLNNRNELTAPQAKLVKDLGRVVMFTSSGDPKRIRSEINRIKTYDERTKKKEVSFFVARQKELAGRDPRSGRGGGGGGGSATGEIGSDEEWYAEYGAWVEEVESWGSDDRELPDVEELPF